MTELNGPGTVIETDVLIIGGGASGLWTAIKAKPFVNTVTVVDKGPTVGPTNPGYFSGGGLDAIMPGGSVEGFVEEMVYFEDGLVEQDVLEAIARQSSDRINDLQRLGANFFKEPDGSLKGVPQRGLKHVKIYTQQPFGIGGKRMISILVQEAKRLGVRFLNKIFITDILTKDGRANGAVGFHTRSGEFFIFKAKAVVLCSGSGNIQTHYPDMAMSTGDGIRMALEASCELRNLEFITMWVVPRLFGWPGITFLLPMGARFVNVKGETFIDKYSPVLKSNCDFNYISMFMALEAREGKGPFYLDCSPMKPEDKDMMQPRGGWTKLQYGKLQKMGLKFFEQKTEWMPAFHGTMGGAVKTNLKMETAVPGLFVGGRLRSTDTGVYMGGWALCTCAAFGCWAGQNAGKYAASSESSQLDADKIAAFKQKIYAPLGKNGPDLEEVIRKVQNAVFPYEVIILKKAKNLTAALGQVEAIRDEVLPQMGDTDPHYLRKLIEVRNMTITAELMLRASLMRTESRASHYREDYPKRDDSNWLKWIIIRKDRDKLKLSTEPMPLDKYKFKPTKFYSDNFRLPR